MPDARITIVDGITKGSATAERRTDSARAPRLPGGEIEPMVGEPQSRVGPHPATQPGNPVISDLPPVAVDRIARELRYLLADVFALYLKTKNFHWHIRGRSFRDYHLMLDDHGDQLFAMTDVIAERARKLGGTTLHSIGDIARHQRLQDQDQHAMDAIAMLTELRDDNAALIRSMRAAHQLCDESGDCATTSLIEVWIDETERRAWFLAEIVGEQK